MSEETIDYGQVTGMVHSTESFGAVDGPGIRFIVFLQDRVQTCQISAYINIHDHYAFLQLHFLVNGDHAAPITCICRCPGLHQTFFVRSHGTVTAVPVVLSFRLQLLQSII